jgi:hypothetical protein
MKISDAQAMQVLREEAQQPVEVPLDQGWVRKVEELSRLCELKGGSKTHIAFLGTAMLAKATDLRADLFAIKPEHAEGNPNAFSARILSENVLVPGAAEFGISIGVTGRQPLNNQPYFRMTRLDDGTPVRRGAKAGFDYMVKLVRELGQMNDTAKVRAALRAYIAVRRRYITRYADHEEGRLITPDRLLAAIIALVREDSEGGRRAQATVAGLMDVFAGPDRVESGRINDPSRKYPGDVCVQSSDDADVWEKAIEVRDKPVSAADVQIFGKKCLDMGVRDGCLVMVSDRQERLDSPSLTRWANEFGIGMTLFHGWAEFVDQALFWAAQPKSVAASEAIGFIHKRLVSVEASTVAVESWGRLTGKP